MSIFLIHIYFHSIYILVICKPAKQHFSPAASFAAVYYLPSSHTKGKILKNSKSRTILHVVLLIKIQGHFTDQEPLQMTIKYTSALPWSTLVTILVTKARKRASSILSISATPWSHGGTVLKDEINTNRIQFLSICTIFLNL